MNWTTAFIENMKAGSVIAIAEVRVKDKDLLIECIKQYIDWYGGVEFNSDYTKIRRIWSRETLRQHLSSL